MVKQNTWKSSAEDCGGKQTKSRVNNTGKMISKYPASLKLITILVNHTTADKNNTWKHKEEDCGGNKPKLG